MKALRVSRNGRPSEALEIVETDAPEPRPGQVRIRVSTGSVNFYDLDRCYARITTIPMPPPFILGMDACGIVDTAGEGGESWIGRRLVAESVHADLLRLTASGVVRPHVGQRVSLSGAAAALEAHEARRSLGRTAAMIDA